METICFRPNGWRRALVLGGARSGKSALAERLARETGLKRTYVATAQAFDAEMAERIARHRLDRGEGWETVEAPLDLGGALAAANRPGSVVLVDCLTLWLSNVMLAGGDVEAESAALCARVAASPGPVALVSNEVGMGLVPDTPLGRAFRDAQGRLNQRMAAVCDLVAFVAAGLPLWLKTP
jgi:adenosylcobinamide kinase/adenosylcobinamide-phosphate guanylyltransferase